MLAGVRVVEFATLVAGPAAGSHLAQLGADVIKVEPPGGEPSRLLTAPGHPDLVAPPYLANNVGKRSVIIDLKDERGAASARGLLATADVVIENYRPGALERLGLDPASAAGRQPPRCTGSRCAATGRRAPGGTVRPSTGSSRPTAG